MKLHWTYKRWGYNNCVNVFVNYVATTTIPPRLCMFSEASFRKGMILYNFAGFWKGSVLLVNTVVLRLLYSFSKWASFVDSFIVYWDSLSYAPGASTFVLVCILLTRITCRSDNISITMFMKHSEDAIKQSINSRQMTHHFPSPTMWWSRTWFGIIVQYVRIIHLSFYST